MRKVSREIFKKDAVYAAKFLLGKVIECGSMKGMIVETEAYQSDPASHAYKITPRSEIMLTTYGKVYVYLIYGIYCCLNFTTNGEEAGAVLIRALEPLEGVGRMKKNRKTDNLHNIASGPGKLCQALGINKSYNNTSIGDKIKLLHHKDISEKEIAASSRIGIKKGLDLEWRFYIKNNKFVSR